MTNPVEKSFIFRVEYRAGLSKVYKLLEMEIEKMPLSALEIRVQKNNRLIYSALCSVLWLLERWLFDWPQMMEIADNLLTDATLHIYELTPLGHKQTYCARWSKQLTQCNDSFDSK